LRLSHNVDVTVVIEKETACGISSISTDECAKIQSRVNYQGSVFIVITNREHDIVVVVYPERCLDLDNRFTNVLICKWRILFESDTSRFDEKITRGRFDGNGIHSTVFETDLGRVTSGMDNDIVLDLVRGQVEPQIDVRIDVRVEDLLVMSRFYDPLRWVVP